jgi:hypothetical protein
MGKIKTILNNPKQTAEAFRIGFENFSNPKDEVELLAIQRLKICMGCEHFKKEPISFLRIKDERIKEASEMMCGDCGCELPYKLRQSKSMCKKWDV